MFRALFELIITILIAWVARAVLASLMKGASRAAHGGFQQQSSAGAYTGNTGKAGDAQRETPRTGELHKDPVCGTYVAESTAYWRKAAGQTFYYCSNACREKHALVAR